MIMHERYGVWVVNDRCGMILACDFIWDSWLSKGHSVGTKYTSIFMVWEGWVGMDPIWHMNEDWL